MEDELGVPVWMYDIYAFVLTGNAVLGQERVGSNLTISLLSDLDDFAIEHYFSGVRAASSFGSDDMTECRRALPYLCAFINVHTGNAYAKYRGDLSFAFRKA